MQVPERKLHRYLSAISERADVRVGSPLPLGTQETCGGVNFSIFSRYASRVQLELFDHPEDAKATRIIELDPARTALETSGTPGWQESLSVSSMRTAWTALMSPVKAIVSISTDSCLIRSRQRFRGYRCGTLHPRGAMTRRLRGKTLPLRHGTIPPRCRNAC